MQQPARARQREGGAVRGRREGGATRGDATTSRRNETTSGQRSDRMMRGQESSTTRGQAMVRWWRWRLGGSGSVGGGGGGRWTNQCKNRRLHTTNPHQTWPPATTHPDANRQCHGTRQTHYSPTKSYPKHSRPWTCGSTGYGAAMPKDNSTITGDLAHRTWQITSPSTTPHTPQVCMPNNSHISQQSRIQETLPEHRRLREIGGHK
jgi:hypothetical protein